MPPGVNTVCALSNSFLFFSVEYVLVSPSACLRIVFILLCSAAVCTPGFTRPIMYSQSAFVSRTYGALANTGNAANGKYKSGGVVDKRSPKNPFGAIPAIVTAFVFTQNVLPMTDRSPPYLLFQNRSLITATIGAPFTSSSSLNSRPVSGRNPNVRK